MRKKLPVINNLNVHGKAVIVRADLEIEEETITSAQRYKATQNIIRYLKSNGSIRIKVIGHKGSQTVDQLKHEFTGVEFIADIRQDPREKDDDVSLAEELMAGFDIYVNEAFATSHRMHVSIDKLPRMMKMTGKQVAIGMRFASELDKLDEVLEMQGKKVLVIGGAKADDKVKYATELTNQFAKVLVGGKLPVFLEQDPNPDIIRGKLREDGLDIDQETIDRFIQQLLNSDITVIAGPMGKFEDPTAGEGTKRVYQTVAESKAVKMAGGGDTEAALAKFGLTERMDWISVGGGAMLEYLYAGTLAGIEAINN